MRRKNVFLFLFHHSLLFLFMLQVWEKLRGRQAPVMLPQRQAQTQSTLPMAVGAEEGEEELLKESMTSTSPLWSSLPTQQREMTS